MRSRLAARLALPQFASAVGKVLQVLKHLIEDKKQGENPLNILFFAGGREPRARRRLRRRGNLRGPFSSSAGLARPCRMTAFPTCPKATRQGNGGLRSPIHERAAHRFGERRHESARSIAISFRRRRKVRESGLGSGPSASQFVRSTFASPARVSTLAISSLQRS